MRIAAAHPIPYRLPLHRPWVAAAAKLTERRGRLLAVTAEDGIVGWGDCAPLPSSGEIGHERVFDALEACCRHLPGADGEALADFLPIDAPAEIRWALETALLDIEARRQGVTLARLLGAHRRRVLVNAALGPLDATCGDRAAAAMAEGFLVAKTKVGIAPIELELARLRALNERTAGRLRLRLDANRAWSETDATHFLTAAAELPIDGVEEPLAAPSCTALARLQAQLPFALAVDESLAELGLDALIAAGAVRRIVVKPARLGGISATLELARRAQGHGIDVVLTSVVESAIGVTATAHLAAALPRQSRAATTHGLATSAWLAVDVAAPPALAAGGIDLSEAPGLGIVPVPAFAAGHRS